MTALPNIGLLTAADLAYVPDDGLRRELYDGVMHVVPPPGGDHGWESYRLDPRTGSYRCEVELGPGEAGELAAPWPVHLDTAELVMPHKR